MWTLKVYLPKNFLNFGNPKTAFPRQKCSRDWERVKDQRKADDVMWRQLVYSAFASDSGHRFVLCGIKAM